MLVETKSLIRALLPTPRGMEDRPSILEQTQYDIGFFKFPGEESFGIEYFNPSLVDWRGQRWLVTRRRRFSHGTIGRNDLVMWVLDGTKVANPQPIRIHIQFPDEHHEDPRAINRDGGLVLTYCNFRPHSRAHMCMGGVTNDFRIPKPIHLIYDGNGPNVMANTRNQKNWLPFIHDSKIHIVYTTHPTHEVLRTENGMVVKVWATENTLPWLWGQPRGGTPPIRISDQYWTFFHSSLPWKKLENGATRNRYYMGALSFDAEPPFTIRSISKAPILAGSDQDRRNKGAPIVVFPCGALLERNEWIVVGGCNDCSCFWIRIPHEDLLKTMT